jgi:hypothetical protein
MPIPTSEVATLVATVVDALDLAELGQAGDGYAVLLSGLARAREAAEDEEEWAPELVRRWEHAVEEFAVRCGIGRA